MAIDKIYIDAEISRYSILFFPVAKYQRVDEISVLTVLWIRIYCRVGNQRSLFGFCY